MISFKRALINVIFVALFFIIFFTAIQKTIFFSKHYTADLEKKRWWEKKSKGWNKSAEN
jgi:hypothetical protein